VEQIEAAVRAASGGRFPKGVGQVATIESRAHEPGLAGFCARHALPLRVFTREQIAAVAAVPTPSATVRALLDLDGVCEPCALLAAAPDAQLVVRKTILDGVTVAIATGRTSRDTAA
jgi:cobalamin biosynthesis protein CbiG